MIEEDFFFPGKPIDDNEDASILNMDSTSTLLNDTSVSMESIPHQTDEQGMVKLGKFWQHIFET
jgi:hypothetical protein